MQRRLRIAKEHHRGVDLFEEFDICLLDLSARAAERHVFTELKPGLARYVSWTCDLFVLLHWLL